MAIAKAEVDAKAAVEDAKALALQAKEWKVPKESIRPKGTIELREIDRRGMAVEYLTTCKACGSKHTAMGGGMPVGEPVKCSSCKITAIAVHAGFS